MHNYYRSLALKLYVDAGKKPELCPTTEEISLLRMRGVTRLWGWPDFLVDQCDDGYDSTHSGLAQAETRYIKQTVDAARSLGLNGMTANAMVPNIFAETLNLDAFARCWRIPRQPRNRSSTTLPAFCLSRRRLQPWPRSFATSKTTAPGTRECRRPIVWRISTWGC